MKKAEYDIDTRTVMLNTPITLEYLKSDMPNPKPSDVVNYWMKYNEEWIKEEKKPLLWNIDEYEEHHDTFRHIMEMGNTPNDPIEIDSDEEFDYCGYNVKWSEMAEGIKDSIKESWLIRYIPYEGELEYYIKTRRESEEILRRIQERERQRREKMIPFPTIEKK